MPKVKQDGMILDGPDRRCILVRGSSLPEVLQRAQEWAAEEGYALADPAAVRVEWIRAIPCPERAHSHDGWECDRRPGVTYLPGRPGRGAFQGILADIAVVRGAGAQGRPEPARAGRAGQGA